METKYKGYEDLLDVDEDDPDIVVPHDVQGSVRALKYALTHPLIFSEPHGTYKERRVKKTKVNYLSAFYETPRFGYNGKGRGKKVDGLSLASLIAVSKNPLILPNVVESP